MELLREIYINDEFGTFYIIATIIAWIAGGIWILMGRKTKDTEDVTTGLGIIFFGSIPFLNGFALMLIILGIVIALIVAGISFGGKWLASKIIGE